MVGPLEGLRVVDLTRNVAGPYATKLLADHGAQVVKIEPPGGDPSRQFGPFPGNVSHPERSGLFLHLNTNKRSIVLDPCTPDGAEAVRALAATADILVEDFAPGTAAAHGWGWDDLKAINPRLVMASVTAFGQTGPYRHYRGSELTLQAMGGAMNATGTGEREPLKLAGHHAQFHAGAGAAAAILLAVRNVEAGQPGDWVDLAIYECQASSRDRRALHLTVASYNGQAIGRESQLERRMANGIRPCLDGYIHLAAGNKRLPGLLKVIGREDLLSHPGINATRGMTPNDLYEEVEGSLGAWLFSVPKHQAMQTLQDHGVLAGGIMTVADVVEDPHWRSRGLWEVIDHPATGPLEYPGRPIIMSGSPRPQPRRAPLLDEHAAEVHTEIAATPASQAAQPGPSSARKHLPLKGIRVADLTVVWAGPHVTQLLAEWGAEVIRAEPTNHIQATTRYAENAPTREQAQELAAKGHPTWYPDNDPGEQPWNRNAAFNLHARHKKSMSCDLGSPEGREAFLKLVAVSDVLVENNVPDRLDTWNLGWDELKKVNPRLVMLRMPAFGLQGPYRGYRALGEQAEALAGHIHLRNYTDESPEVLNNAVGSDAMAGVQGAAAVLMALRHRDRSGQGQLMEMPLSEAFIPTLAEFTLDYKMNDYDTPSQGNLHRWNAPHNSYPCAGDDQWIAIDVATDAEFAALCTELGAPELAAGEKFATAHARKANLAELDTAIGALTASRDKLELFHRLQAAGVCATPVLDALEAHADPQLNDRGFFVELPTNGKTYRYPGLMFRMAGTPNQLHKGPPTLGEHNREIYLDLLGYSEEELAAMEAKGLVGTAYPDALWRRPQPARALGGTPLR